MQLKPSLYGSGHATMPRSITCTQCERRVDAENPMALKLLKQ